MTTNTLWTLLPPPKRIRFLIRIKTSSVWICSSSFNSISKWICLALSIIHTICKQYIGQGYGPRPLISQWYGVIFGCTCAPTRCATACSTKTVTLHSPWSWQRPTSQALRTQRARNCKWIRMQQNKTGCHCLNLVNRGRGHSSALYWITSRERLYGRISRITSIRLARLIRTMLPWTDYWLHKTISSTN